MFTLFRRSPVKKLKQQHSALLAKAFQAQRDGDIRRYSLLTAEAEDLRSAIEKLESDTAAF